MARLITNCKSTTNNLFCSILFFQYFMPAGAASEPPQTEWILTQRYQQSGFQTIYVSNSAVKITTSFGCCLLAKAPDWKVEFYRPSEKTIWEGTIEEIPEFSSMLNPYKRRFGYVKTGEFSALRTGEGIVAGIKYTAFTSDNSFRRLSYWTANEIKVDPNCGKVICRATGLPPLKQIPLYIRVTRKDPKTYAQEAADRRQYWVKANQSIVPNDLRSGPIERLSTLASKQTTFRSSDFEIPSNYMRVKDLIDVAYSRSMKKDAESVFAEFGELHRKL